MYNEQLKILDMNKEEQWIFVVTQLGLVKCLELIDEKDQVKRQAVLADVAFRLRDETIEMVESVGHLGLAWVDAVCEVIQYCEGRKYCKECGQEHNTKKLFDWSRDAQPIHWIVAALILQEMLRKEMREH